MSFEELVRALDQLYTDKYSEGREEALQDFGRKQSAALAAALAAGHTLEELVNKAQIGPPGYWAEQIAKGMRRSD